MKKFYALYLLLFSMAMYAQPTIGTPQDLYTCDDNGDGYATFDLSTNDLPALGSLNPDEYTVAYFQTNADAQQNVNALPATYGNVVANNQTVYVRVTENEDADNFAVASFDLIVTSVFEVDSIVSVGDDFVITLSAPGTYQYTIFTAPPSLPVDLPFNQGSNIFVDMPFGQYSLMIENGCGNVITISFDHALTAPVGEAEQTFTEGETLADLDVQGDNLKWYPSATSQEQLPLTTILVNNTTYYASQTVNGEESTQRLAVTASQVLGLADTKFASLIYYPNPVNNIFTITNNNAIEAVSIYTIMGQQVSTKSVNNTNATVDFSALNSGIYFVKVQIGNTQKSIKVVKQ
jgi:hypothetical protein